MILEEFSHQIDQARDISETYEGAIRKIFRKHHMAVDSMLLLEYENGQREAYLTVKTTNGRCVTAKDAARLMGQAVPGGAWSPAKDSRSIINRQYAALRFEEDGAYHMLFGAARSAQAGGEMFRGQLYVLREPWRPGNHEPV